MTITDRTRKLLWGRSANRCAICRRQLIISGIEGSNDSISGQECHIVAHEPNGPRGDSDLTDQLRDDYDNLILLCNIHHKMIDDQPESFTINKLKSIKLEHERWVTNSLNLLDIHNEWNNDLEDNKTPLHVTQIHPLPDFAYAYKAQKESDGTFVEGFAAPSTTISKSGSFFVAGFGFSITNNSQITVQIKNIFIDVLSVENLIVIEKEIADGAGGAAQTDRFWCELLPITGVFECRLMSDEYDYIKVTGHDLEYFEIYIVERSFKNLLYNIQFRMDFIFGMNEYSIHFDPMSVGFLAP